MNKVYIRTSNLVQPGYKANNSLMFLIQTKKIRMVSSIIYLQREILNKKS